MAQYKAFEENIEAGGNELSVTALSNMNRQQRLDILEKYGLSTEQGIWNSLQALLDALKEVSNIIGEENFLGIGKSVVDNARFPPIDGLENALMSMDIAYHMNHKKNGQVMYNADSGEMLEGIGHYKLTNYDEVSKKATIVCYTPYPSKFEEGLILQIVNKFKPKNSEKAKVMLDPAKESRLHGGDTCTFNISW